MDLGGQEWMRAYFGENNPKEAYANAGPAHTLTVDGEVLACAGLIAWNRFRATSWAFLSHEVRKHFLPGHLFVKQFLRESDFKRIEAFVDVDFEKSMKWLPTLGFKPDGPPKEFWFVDGRTAQEFIFIKRNR